MYYSLCLKNDGLVEFTKYTLDNNLMVYNDCEVSIYVIKQPYTTSFYMPQSLNQILYQTYESVYVERFLNTKIYKTHKSKPNLRAIFTI